MSDAPPTLAEDQLPLEPHRPRRSRCNEAARAKLDERLRQMTAYERVMLSLELGAVSAWLRRRAAGPERKSASDA